MIKELTMTDVYNSYLDDIRELQKKLDIATKALSCVYHDMKLWTFISKRDDRVLSVISKALKEMEEV